MEIDFFLFFFRKIVSKNFELKVLENCEFEREYFFLDFYHAPFDFSGEKCIVEFSDRSVQNCIERNTAYCERLKNCSEEYFRSILSYPLY